KFISNLSKEIVKIEPSCMLHPNIMNAYDNGRMKAVEQPDLQIEAEYDKSVNNNYARQTVASVSGEAFINNPILHQEIFGPYSMIVECENAKQLEQIVLK